MVMRRQQARKPRRYTRFIILNSSVLISPMTPVYLRHRASVSDPWTEPPSFATLYPTTPIGAMPATQITIESATEFETPCGCPDTPATHDHLALKVTMPPIPVALSAQFINFLFNYSQATLYEAKMSRYGAGTYKTTEISNIRSKETAGQAIISFRLATPIATALS
jgi:hypothetical protein